MNRIGCSKFDCEWGEVGLYYNQPSYHNMVRNHNLEPMKSKIQVTGEGSVSIQPDTAKIILGVEVEDVELQKAQSINAKTISNIIQAITNAGIPKENILTTNFTIFPIYDFVDGKQVFRGYRVEHMLQVTVEDIENVGSVVDLAVQTGANRFSNISFQLANPQIAYREALKKAVNDAVQKAKTIANTLRINLNKTPVQVIEQKNCFEGPTPFMESSMVKSATTEIEPGKQEIIAFVTAIFTTA